jgi:transposase
MTVENINIDATIKRVEALIAKDKDLSSAAKSLLEILILIITLLANRLNLNSKNSSKPPSRDPNRKRSSNKKNDKSPGGQNGHIGKTLGKVKTPDKVKVINVDRSKLPPGNYKEIGHESRQVFDIDISRVVTEYQAQVLEDEKGRRFTAPFPEGITKAVQYGASIKAHSVYLSQFQLIPYDRIRDCFADQLEIPVSAGSIFNFNKQAFGLLEGFDNLVRGKLSDAALVHADETGININGGKY